MIAENLKQVLSELPEKVRLVAVSKFHPNEAIEEAYRAGQRVFGESKVQEMTAKYESLPKDIEWHFIGHLQTNKIKYIVPYVALIHGIDSYKLLAEVNKQAAKAEKTVNCLLQLHIARRRSQCFIAGAYAPGNLMVSCVPRARRTKRSIGTIQRTYTALQGPNPWLPTVFIYHLYIYLVGCIAVIFPRIQYAALADNPFYIFICSASFCTLYWVPVKVSLLHALKSPLLKSSSSGSATTAASLPVSLALP